MTRRVAFVTGASRGIGRATALAFARAGYDVVVTARTVTEGTGRQIGGAPGDASPALEGSIERTAQEVRELGREALPIAIDLLEPASLDAAVARTRAEWGRIDVLVNNAIYQGVGGMEPVEALTRDMLEKTFQGNVFSQVQLIQRVLPPLLERGDGIVINVVSGSGMTDPPAPVGEQGGWGFAYAASKAAFLRLAGVLAVEHRDRGVRFYNLEPGFVITEALRAQGKEREWAAFGGAPPEVPAAVMVWLATHPDEAARWHGRTLFAQKFAADRKLVPGWPE